MRKVMLVGLVLLVVGMAPVLADPRGDTGVLGEDVTLPGGDYGVTTPFLTLDKEGTGFLLIDRSFTANFPMRDYAYDALVEALDRNPGLLDQFFQNELLPNLASADSRLVVGSTSDDFRAANARMLERFASSKLGAYVDGIRQELQSADAGVEVEPTGGIEADWYFGDRPDDPGVQPLGNRYVLCTFCNPGENGGAYCGRYGLCVWGCAGSSGNCTHIIVQPRPVSGDW